MKPLKINGSHYTSNIYICFKKKQNSKSMGGARHNLGKKMVGKIGKIEIRRMKF